MGMEFKARKCRSLSVEKRRVVDRWLQIGEERIPTLREESVKSLGRVYAVPLTDRSRGREVQGEVERMLKVIETSNLTGPQKV
jgi:hypothetical protein